MSKKKKKQFSLFASLEAEGYDPRGSFKSGLSTRSEKVKDFTGDIARGLYAFPSDMSSKAMNTVLDVADATGLEEAIYGLSNMAYGQEFGYRPMGDKDPYRFSGVTEVSKGERDVSNLEEGVSDFTGVMAGLVMTGGTASGVQLANWGNRGNIGRRVFAGSLQALPVDVLLSDDSGEHLFFEDNKEESAIKRRAKNVVENAGLGVVGDFAIQGISKAYRAIRGTKGKTKDDAIQSAFNEEVPKGQADQINKVRPTAELKGDAKLKATYKKNPMYKMENREAIDEIDDEVVKQMDNVSKDEYRVRHGVVDGYNKASEKAEIPFEGRTEGIDEEEHIKAGFDALKGKQSREEILNIFDAFTSGKISDEKMAYYTRDYLMNFTDPLDDDLMRVMNNQVTSEERATIMRKVREKFANNPFTVDPKDFEFKARANRALSEAMGLTTDNKVRRTHYEILNSYVDLATKADNDKTFAKALAKWSKNTNMDKRSLLRMASEMNITTSRMPEYVRAFNDLVDDQVGALANASQKLLKVMKASRGQLDIASKEFQEWLTALGASTEIFESVAGFRGNLGRAMNAMREHAGHPLKSWLKQYEATYKLGAQEKLDEGAKNMWLRAQHLTKARQQAIYKSGKVPKGDKTDSLVKLAQDPEGYTKELIKMVRGTSSLDKAKKFVGQNFKRDVQGLADMFISQGIANLLASPMTIGRIFMSTASFVAYKNTLIPFYEGLINKITKGDTGQRPIADVINRWASMMEVARVYASVKPKQVSEALLKNKTPEQIAKMSRGFKGLQIEGQGFTSLSFKELNKKVIEYANGNLLKQGFGHLLTLPTWLGNMVMNNGILPTDDFFRRAMLEAETNASIRNLYHEGINAGASKKNDLARAFDNYDDYYKSMKPLFEDIKNGLFKTKDMDDVQAQEVMEAVFSKHEITRLDPDARAIIMPEILSAERKASEAVSQEATDDIWLANSIRGFLNGVESMGPLGRIASATLVPFQTAPINIMRSSMEETPIVQALSKRWRDKLRYGSDKEKAEAIAQSLSGITVGIGAWSLVNSFPTYGHIPIEELNNAQQLGIQPYSIVIDGRSYSYDFLGTFKAPLAMMADFKRYGVAGDNTKSYMQILKTFAIASGDNPYFDSMSEIVNVLSGEGSTKDVARVLASKSTQFAQFGSGLDRTLDIINGSPIETSALTGELETFYDSVWLRELDMKNKDNPVYRMFRDITDPKAYTTKTNLFGDPIFKNDGEWDSFAPFFSLGGVHNMPATTSPGIMMLQELDLVNKDFTKIGDVHVSGQKAQELKERVFGDSGLGLARTLDAYALNDDFMGSPDSNRSAVLSKIITDHISKVESEFSVDVIQKQAEIDKIKKQLDFDSYGSRILRESDAQATAKIIYEMGRRKNELGSIQRNRVLDVLKD